MDYLGNLKDHEVPLLRLADSLSEPSRERDPFINRGLSLQSMILLEAFARFGLERHREFANEKLRGALDELERRPLSTSLYRGITGVGWLVRSYAREIDEEWTDQFINDLDEHLIDGLCSTNNPSIDVVDGVSGITLYAISGPRGDASRSRDLLTVLHDSLMRCVHRYVSANSFALGDSYRNLGLAHGVPGLLLSAALVTEKLGRPPEPALIDGFRKLWSFALIEGGSACFPYVEGRLSPARLAWCYGNLGIWSAFNAVSRMKTEFRDQCDQLMRAIMDQHEAGSGALEDSCICHGHSGIIAFASFAKRQSVDHQVRLDAVLEESVVTTTASISGPGTGPPTVIHIQEGRRTPLINFLEGSAGCALALSAIRDVDAPRWQGLLGYV